MFDHSAQPQSPAEWLELARQDQQAAIRLANDPITAGRAWDHAGHAVECALKAAIMSRSGMNGWPRPWENPTLNTHDLKRLADIAGIVISPRDAIAPSWATVLLWTRGQSYNPKTMPRAVIRDMMSAAFGPKGVLPWIRSTCLTRI